MALHSSTIGITDTAGQVNYYLTVVYKATLR